MGGSLILAGNGLSGVVLSGVRLACPAAPSSCLSPTQNGDGDVVTQAWARPQVCTFRGLPRVCGACWGSRRIFSWARTPPAPRPRLGNCPLQAGTTLPPAWQVLLGGMVLVACLALGRGPFCPAHPVWKVTPSSAVSPSQQPPPPGIAHIASWSGTPRPRSLVLEPPTSQP